MRIAVNLLETITSKELRFSRDVPLQQFAEFAFESCCKWFGAPRDAKWPYYIVAYPNNFCMRSLWRSYLIGLSQTSRNLEQRCYFLGHEMYHRVTMASPIFKSWWLDEIMASAVALQLLREYNMSDFADQCKKELLKLPIEIGFCELQTLKRPRKLPIHRQDDPKGFGAATARLAIAVRRLVTWDELCQLVVCGSLKDWITVLPPEEQPFVRMLFSCDPFGSSEDLSDRYTEGYVEFAHSLKDLGNEEAAIAALRQVIRKKPCLTEAHSYMGVLLHSTNKEDEAIAAWQMALDCGSNSPSVWYNLGRTYFLRADYDKAASYLQKALTVDPEHSGSKYYLDLLATKK